jgi:hypothetical protein
VPVVALDAQLDVVDVDGHGLAGVDTAQGDLLPATYAVWLINWADRP